MNDSNFEGKIWVPANEPMIKFSSNNEYFRLFDWEVTLWRLQNKICYAVHRIASFGYQLLYVAVCQSPDNSANLGGLVCRISSAKYETVCRVNKGLLEWRILLRRNHNGRLRGISPSPIARLPSEFAPTTRKWESLSQTSLALREVLHSRAIDNAWKKPKM